MTISSTVGTDMTVDTLVKRALQTAGLLRLGGTPSSEEYDYGRDILNTQLKELMFEGTNARWVDFYELTLTASDFTYSLPATITDIVGDGQYIAASESDTSKASSETLVQQVDRETWHHQSTKSTESRPYLFFADKAVSGDQLEVKFWPIPDEAGTVRFQVYSLPADTLSGEATLDLREPWMQALIWDLAHQFAVAASLPEARCSMLNKRAQEKKVRARSDANQKVSNQFVLMHPTGWSGRVH